MEKSLKCPLCNKEDKLTLLTKSVRFGKNADVYKCEICGLIFLDQGSFEFPKDFYEKEYHQTYITHVEPDALNPEKYYEKMKKATKIWGDKFLSMLEGNEVVLDVGCSTGHFIDLVKDKTKKIFGYDLNKKEVEFCKNKRNLNVSCEPLEKTYAENSFDYITMMYVLEHIAKPQEFLKSLAKFLKPKGKFVILVPNAEDALINFYDIPEFKNFYYCIEHLFYYTPATIRRLFSERALSGTIETIQEYPITNHLNWVYRRKPSDTLASRRGVPDVATNATAPNDAWRALWKKIDALYKNFLKANRYGDRLWCVVGKTESVCGE